MSEELMIRPSDSVYSIISTLYNQGMGEAQAAPWRHSLGQTKTIRVSRPEIQLNSRMSRRSSEADGHMSVA